jgi:hypothetical protein
LSVREQLRRLQEHPEFLERLKGSPEAQELYAQITAGIDANPLEKWDPAVSPRDGRNRQAEFLEAREPFKLYAGGNGAGKSSVGTVDDLIQLCDEAAVPKHLRRFKRWEPPVPMRVVVPKMAVIEGATLEAFRDLTPRSQLVGDSFDKAYKQQSRKLLFKNGSYVLFNTGDQDRDAHSAVELRRVRFDEEPEGDHGRGIFTENVARLRSFLPEAQITFTMTPLFGLSWVYDTIWERRDDPDVFCVVASMLDNPHINAEATIAALGHLSKEEREAVVEGRFVHVSGTVLTVTEDHIVEPITPRHLEGQDVLVGIDPGISRGGVVWCAFDRDNHMLAFDELYPESLDTPRIAARIMVKNAEWGIGDAMERRAGRAYFQDLHMRDRIPEGEFEGVMKALEAPAGPSVTYIIDPTARNREHVNAQNVQGEYARAGINAHPGQNDRRSGILQMRSRLEYGAFHVTSNCVKWLYEARRWLIATDEIIAEGKATVKGAGGTFATVGPDHLQDPTRYVAQERVWFEGYPEESRPRRFGWEPNRARPMLFRGPAQEAPPMGSFS